MQHLHYYHSTVSNKHGVPNHPSTQIKKPYSPCKTPNAITLKRNTTTSSSLPQPSCQSLMQPQISLLPAYVNGVKTLKAWRNRSKVHLQLQLRDLEKHHSKRILRVETVLALLSEVQLLVRQHKRSVGYGREIGVVRPLARGAEMISS